MSLAVVGAQSLALGISDLSSKCTRSLYGTPTMYSEGLDVGSQRE